MQTLIAICAVLAALFSLLAFGVAVVIAKQIQGTWNDVIFDIDHLSKNMLDVFAFIRHRYDQAAAANGKFREDAATAKTQLEAHMAQCHADDPKPEDTPAFTELINEEATHKLAEFFEAAGIKPDEASKSIDLIEGEVTKIVEAEQELDFIESFEHPTRGYEDVELPACDGEPRESARHYYGMDGVCQYCGADSTTATDESNDSDAPMSQEYEDAVWPGHSERKTL